MITCACIKSRLICSDKSLGDKPGNEANTISRDSDRYNHVPSKYTMATEEAGHMVPYIIEAVLDLKISLGQQAYVDK